MRGVIFMLSYDRGAALAYAHRYALAYNPAYYSFDKLGGDCTSFISQCLYAGYPEMNYSKNGWFYRNAGSRAPAWTGVEFLYSFLTSGGSRPGPRARQTGLMDLEVGDIVQLSFDGAAFTHSLLIVEISERGILIATHSDDSDYRPLNTYRFRELRALHVE